MPCKILILILNFSLQDGGCCCPGDVAKAIGAGADFVMLGGMLAGHDQSGGEVITDKDGKKRKLFYGMSSATAMKKHKGGVAEYRYLQNHSIYSTILFYVKSSLFQGFRGQER
jgi:IMP dehydrogenase/GMP reductase